VAGKRKIPSLYHHLLLAISIPRQAVAATALIAAVLMTKKSFGEG
jgi:hypothetical protein